MSDYKICVHRDCEQLIDDPKLFASATSLHHGGNADIFHKFNRHWERIRKSI